MSAQFIGACICTASVLGMIALYAWALHLYKKGDMP